MLDDNFTHMKLHNVDEVYRIAMEVWIKISPDQL